MKTTMNENGVFVFPEMYGGRSTSNLDPNLLLALNQNGGFGGNGNWIWILFLWMMWQNGGFNNYRNQGGSFADLAAQMNGDTGREFVTQILGGKIECVNQLAQMVNSSVDKVSSAVSAIQTSIASVGGQIGMSALQTQNAIALGNMNLAQQIAECCCENRLAIATQTNSIQSQAAQNFAALQLQEANNRGEDRLALAQQTNQILSSDSVNTNAIIGAIKDQSTMITKQFCDLKERELQNKIDAQGNLITQLRGQISNDQQTANFNAAFTALTERLARIESHQPNTVPVQYPNVVAVKATPSFVPSGCGCGSYSGWGSNFNGGVVL